jgi:hypothetical protein
LKATELVLLVARAYAVRARIFVKFHFLAKIGATFSL